MQGSNDSFQKTQKKNRGFDDGYVKQSNTKKSKQKSFNNKKNKWSVV